MSEYQRLAQRTSRHDLDMRQHLFNGILGLVGEAGEAGEAADLVKKHYYQDGRRIGACTGRSKHAHILSKAIG